MKNMRVSLKLTVSFIIMIVFATAVGAVGIIGMYQINAADDALYTTNYLPTVLAGDISQNVYEQRTHLRSLVLYDSVEEAQAFNSANNDLEQSLTQMSTFLIEYDKTIVNDDDRIAFNEFMDIYERDWLPFVAQIRRLGTDGKGEEAKALLSSAGPAAAADKLDELTSELQQINMSDGAESLNKNTALYKRLAFLEGAILVAAAVIAILLNFYIAGIISKPLSVMAAALEQIGSVGDLHLTPEMEKSAAECSTWKDEIGTCARAIGGLLAHLEDVEKSLAQIAGGDLTIAINTLSDRDNIGISVTKLLNSLNRMFGEINLSTTQVSTGSKQIADGAQSLAQGSTEQASAVEQLSSSITEIAQKTKNNAEMAVKAATLANSIMSSAEKGSRQMGDMMAAVKEINDASQSINKVIKVIDDIAFQTNILALNAAVEAARAGQHGKGFAVVAEEVRNLAAKSAEAAKDTEGLIANSMEKAELGARIADDTAASLNEIVTGISTSTQLVSDIAKSSDEQSAGIFQINIGIDQVAQVVQQNSATAEESAAASEEMSGQAEMLQNLVAQFRLKGGGSERFQGLPFAGNSAYEPLTLTENSEFAIGPSKY